MFEFFLCVIISICIVGMIGRICHEGDYNDYD